MSLARGVKKAAAEGRYIPLVAMAAAKLADELDNIKARAEAAEEEMRKAREQEPVAWMTHEYQGTGEKRLQFQPHIPSIRDDVTGPIVTALYAAPKPAANLVESHQIKLDSNSVEFDGIKTEEPADMTDDALKEILNAAQIVGCGDALRVLRGFAMRVLREWGNQEGMHKAFLDAVNPAVAVPAVPDQFCDVTKLIVPQEWRDVITELADDLSIELDMRYQSRSHYPSELRKYENEMQPVYRARALLQSTGDKK